LLIGHLEEIDLWHGAGYIEKRVDAAITVDCCLEHGPSVLNED